MKTFFKNKRPQILPEEMTEDERFFFHDLLNHTHGVLLFLSHKKHSKAGLGHDEVEMLINEVSKMQSLIKSKGVLDHRHLACLENAMTIKDFMSQLQALVSTYLPATKFLVTFTISGAEDYADCTIAVTNWSRIMLNLIKNIADHGSGNVELQFKFVEDQLILTTINECRLTELNKRLNGGGLGLDSIREQTRFLGGSFVSCSSEGMWKAKISLPLNSNNSAKKSA